MAPGFGEDDQRVCEAAGIVLVCPVDEKGCFTAEVSDWVGMQVLDANKPIIKHLKDRGVLLRHETYVHNYPHCYRTDTPLIYRAVSSWYVRVSEFKDRMVELNQAIDWIPAHIRDGQFGTWLANARDWSISRNRFWGSPIPVWRSDDPRYPRTDVHGSLDELARDFGVRPTDLHRPFIDELTRSNPDDPTGKSMMRRVPEVLDCWFESGSMPFAGGPHARMRPTRDKRCARGKRTGPPGPDATAAGQYPPSPTRRRNSTRGRSAANAGSRRIATAAARGHPLPAALRPVVRRVAKAVD